ncbi:hypothetical protein HQQ94_16385 [Shewanella sp. VB17]|uniref:hypothetical protein n=1 Tax=Shewanella sp. VB17 TaxID=2739432 RepID=UPI00156345B6|nr:hypothetical protein [Shewanella sp. VB17]NRD74766.1 hypothetical protein [Shewanella sp. VB17]
MYEQIEKPKENKSRAVANSVAQKKSNGKQGVGFVDNRQKVSGVNLFSKSSIQLMAQGNQQARIQERRIELGQIRMPNMVDTPNQVDLDTAGNEIDIIQSQIEGAVNANVLKPQSHGGNMNELKERFHNDQVWRTYRNGVDAGHLQRTRELKASRTTARALDKTKIKLRGERKVISDDIIQL